MSAKKYIKVTVTQVLTKTTNMVSPTENEVNELILIANNNPQKVKQFIGYKS